jgi:CD109 antigen
VFVQTDKSIYKPADKVQFRVLLIDSETRPYNPTTVQVFITDGAGNRVKQFDGVKFMRGIYQNELKLSDLPVMGQWKINVKVNGQREVSKEFEVAEYVLPKFEFILDANTDANFKDGKITATARAKYTFGKIAKGNATITAEKKRQWWGQQNKKVTKTVEVDGKKFVEFDIEKELGITEKYQEHTVDLSATFTEELSGKEQNATAKVQIHITPHKIEMKRNGDKFKPGLNYKISALVKYHEKGAPVTDARNPVKFTTKHYYDVDEKCKKHVYRPRTWNRIEDRHHSRMEEEEYDCREEKSYEVVKDIFVKNGVADLELEIPLNTTKIDVEVRFGLFWGLKNEVFNLNLFDSVRRNILIQLRA